MIGVGMPTATELCAMYNKDELINEFINMVTIKVEVAARHGDKHENVDIPAGLTKADIEQPLKNAFPECKVAWRWFIQSYEIRWA
jgi:hypothetical protein